MRNTIIKTVRLFTLSVLIFSSVPAMSQVTNGYNAVGVDYPGGSFNQQTRTTWKEYTSKREVWNFKETNRDEWSVYLLDESRGVSIQLDLWKKEIYINWDKPNRSKLYSITKVQAGRTAATPTPPAPPAPVYNAPPPSNPGITNGYNVVGVDYPNGSFNQQTSTTWKEYTSRREVWNFRETNRDEWSVYLLDDSRGVSIQLDLWKKEIYINWDKPNRSKLYDIQKVQARR